MKGKPKYVTPEQLDEVRAQHLEVAGSLARRFDAVELAGRQLKGSVEGLLDKRDKAIAERIEAQVPAMKDAVDKWWTAEKGPDVLAVVRVTTALRHTLFMLGFSLGALFLFGVVWLCVRAKAPVTVVGDGVCPGGMRNVFSGKSPVCVDAGGHWWQDQGLPQETASALTSPPLGTCFDGKGYTAAACATTGDSLSYSGAGGVTVPKVAGALADPTGDGQWVTGGSVRVAQRVKGVESIYVEPSVDCWVHATNALGKDLAREIFYANTVLLADVRADQRPVIVRSSCPGHLKYEVDGAELKLKNESATPETRELVRLP